PLEEADGHVLQAEILLDHVCNERLDRAVVAETDGFLALQNQSADDLERRQAQRCIGEATENIDGQLNAFAADRVERVRCAGARAARCPRSASVRIASLAFSLTM